MNQNEIDAGPPNKKPKIGMNQSVLISNNSLTNGLSTQISESTGELLNNIF